MNPAINLMIFSFLALSMLVLSVLAVTSKTLLRSATYLLLVLICTAGLYLFLNYHFLAAVQVSVYAGGIVILFVFAIFLTTKRDEVIQKRDISRYMYAALAVLAGIGVTFFVLFKSRYLLFANQLEVVGDEPVPMQSIGTALMGTEKYQYLLPFEILSILLLASIIGAIIIARKK